MESYFENRQFKLWFYHVTHGEAIIRSLKNESFERNIDIYFGDIKYIEMPTVLSELRLECPGETDIIYLSKRIGKTIQPNDVTVLISGDNRFYIVASIIQILENSLDMFDLPIATFMKE